jgi:hypothetical protein
MNFILITIYTNKTTYLKLSKDSIFNSNFNTNVNNKNFKSITQKLLLKQTLNITVTIIIFTRPLSSIF